MQLSAKYDGAEHDAGNKCPNEVTVATLGGLLTHQTPRDQPQRNMDGEVGGHSTCSHSHTIPTPVATPMPNATPSTTRAVMASPITPSSEVSCRASL